jgi:hypothetical protein
VSGSNELEIELKKSKYIDIGGGQIG